MPEDTTTPQAKPQVSANRSMREFLETHPCGEQIRQAIKQDGVAQVFSPAAAPARTRKPR